MKKVELYKNIAWQFLLQATRYLFPFLLIPYLARIFGVDGYSSYVYVVSFAVFVQVFVEFGFNMSATRYIAKEADKYKKETIINNIFVVRVLLGIIAIIISVLAIFNIQILKNNFEFSFLIIVAACIRGMWPDYIFQAFENLGPITVRFFFARSLAVLPVFLFVKSFDDVNLIAIFEIFSAIVSLLWTYYTVYKLFGIRIKFSNLNLKKMFFYLKDTFSCCASNMAANSTSGLTTLILGISILSLSDISYWSLAVTSLAAVQAMFVPITNALYPHIVVNNNTKFVNKIAIFALPILVVITLFFCIESNLIIKIIGGSEYLQGGYVFYWISPTIIFSFYSMLYGWPVLGAKGYTGKLASATIVSSVVCLVSIIFSALFFNMNLVVVCLIRCFSEFILMILCMFWCFKLKLI